MLAHVMRVEALAKRSKVKQARLLREFLLRVGDPNEGGATRQGAGHGVSARCTAVFDVFKR